jgi:streptogramin lyase
VGEVIAFLRSASAEVAPVASLVVPPELAAGFELVLEASASAQEALDSAEAAVAAGDLVAAERLVVRHIGHLRSITGRLGLMGARCGNVDPARVATADLTVPLDLGAEHINVGHGSVWVSQKAGDNVVRVDPETGEVRATVDVGIEPLKLQRPTGACGSGRLTRTRPSTPPRTRSPPRWRKPTSGPRRTATSPSTVRCGSATDPASTATTWRRCSR